MKKAQASSKHSSLVQELITFPGYASVLLGWLTAFAFAVWWGASLLGGDAKTDQTVVMPITGSAGGSGVFEAAIGAAVIMLLLAAIWVYVAHWTKRALWCVAEMVHVTAQNYWVFCTIVLMAGWVIADALLFEVSGDRYLPELLFTSAGAILIGSLSFGLAALKKLSPVPKAEAVAFSVKFKGKTSKVGKTAKRTKKS